MVSRAEVHASGRPPPYGPPTFVIRARVLDAGDLEPGIARAKTEIDILEREKERIAASVPARCGCQGCSRRGIQGFHPTQSAARLSGSSAKSPRNRRRSDCQ